MSIESILIYIFIIAGPLLYVYAKNINPNNCTQTVIDLDTLAKILMVASFIAISLLGSIRH